MTLNFKNTLFLGLIIILIRISVLSYFQCQANSLHPARSIFPLGIIQNDYYMFLGVVDNYFEYGSYELNKGSGEIFAGRMPGYAAPYFLLRLLISKELALPSLIIFQVILSLLGIFFLAKLAYKWCESKFVFFGVLLIFSVSSYTSIYDIFTLAESFSVSAIILSFYYLDKALRTLNLTPIYFILSGSFLTWAIFLRPFLGLLIIFIPLIIVYTILKLYKGSFIYALKIAIFFCTPFLIFESIWVYRNYSVKDEIILLETGLSESYGEFGIYGKAAMGIRKLINSYGGDAAEFRYGSDAWWFHHSSKSVLFNFPSWLIKNNEVRLNSLIDIKEGYKLSVDSSLNIEERKLINTSTEQKAIELANEIRNENPMQYYIIANLKRIQRFIFTNGTYLLPLPKFSEMNPLQKGIKISYFALYLGVITFGFLGMLFIRPNKYYRFPIILTSYHLLALIIAIVFVGGIIENRYFITMYPFLLIFSLIFIRSIYKSLKKYDLV